MSGAPSGAPRRAFVALGANLGDTAATLASACKALAGLPGTQLRAQSSLYRSAPVEAIGPDFLNAVVELSTTLAAPALLAGLQAIEDRHGRVRSERNAPRTLDLDLLLYADQTIATPTLTVPHPRLHERAFVLVPLAELDAGLSVPGLGPISQLFAAVADQVVARVPGSGAWRDAPAAPMLRRLRHVAIEGPIGVGKTALALRLARWLDGETLLEATADNPFLERFYGDRAGYAFQTQLFFLFQRVAQMRQAAQPGMFSRSVVSDFMFDKDALYARLNLGDEEYQHYALMFGRLAPQLPQPDLVIWLRSTPQTLLGRIRRRAIEIEQRIDEPYLGTLCHSYAEFFRTYAGAPVLGVDCDRSHPAETDAGFEQLLGGLQTLREGRHGPQALEEGAIGW